jgi:hypothetical protein
MNPQHLKGELEARWKEARILPEDHTALSGCAQEVLGMMDAYRRDGDTFLRRGDHPDALASFAYALGWSDAAACIGLISTPRMGFPTGETGQGVTIQDDPWLAEKTGKYDRHLGTAIAHLRPAAEEGSCLHDTAERFLLVTRVFHDHGDRCRETGDLTEALASYSYGSGWLDASVRTGLFRITGRRELFTI